MQRFRTFVRSSRAFCRDEHAASMVEYSLLMSLLVVACLLAMQTMGSAFANFFNSLSNTIDGLL